MSDTTNETIDASRTPEEKLKALIRKDIDPDITAMAERALELRQEGSL